MYADDTTIYFNLEDFDSHNTEAEIDAELEKGSTWLKLNKLSLNAQKTKLMLQYRSASLSIDPAFRASACTDCEYIERTIAIIIIVILVRSLFLVY